MTKVYFETYGCSHNFSDTAFMQSEVRKDTTLETTNEISKADVIVLNTCTVKNKTVTNFKKRLQFLEKKYPRAKVVLAGCMTQASKSSKFSETPEMLNYSMIGTNNLKDITLAITSQTLFQKIESQKRNPGFQDTYTPIETIPISTGCLHFCTFCHTKLARGQLTSYPISTIKDHVENAISKGSKVIFLTSQDNGCYGFDIGENSAKLLQELVTIKGDFMIRFGMANPTHVKKILPELLHILKHPKIFSFLHIPIQSGSDTVLLEMKRENLVSDFKEILQLARKEIPSITISTDIIIGFPNETEEDFKKTLALLEETKPDVINRAKYSKRPSTKAAKMKQLPGKTISERSKKLSLLVENISQEKNKSWIGWEGKAIIEDIQEKNILARNESYKPIVIEKSNTSFKKGDWVKIKITNSTIFHLIGELQK